MERVSANGASAPALRTHDGLTYPATRVSSVEELCRHVNKVRPRLVVIDEVQFFSEEDLADFVHQARKSKSFDLVLVGLVHRADGRTFATTARVLPYCSRVTSLSAPCTECGLPATRSQWLGSPNTSTDPANPNRVGGSELYSPRCMQHWIPS